MTRINKIRERFNSYYRAKFIREGKRNPSHWLILPDGHGWFYLEQVRGFEK